MAGQAKYGYLLDDVDVRRWYNNVARGSRVTAEHQYALVEKLRLKLFNTVAIAVPE